MKTFKLIYENRCCDEIKSEIITCASHRSAVKVRNGRFFASKDGELSHIRIEEIKKAGL
jgi:hypothetical protein